MMFHPFHLSLNKMSYVDTPDKKQKHPHYEHQTIKLNAKDNEFSIKEFQKIRKDSTHKHLRKSFGRISMCLNNKDSSSIPTNELSKVCLILINTYEDEDTDLGVGPLNDGYLVALKHHRLGYKVFYLYNPKCEEFISYLEFFLTRTEQSLTVFYSGRDSDISGNHGIEFVDDKLSKYSINSIFERNCDEKLNVVLITDCISGGSVFDLRSISQNHSKPLNIVSFSVNKNDVKGDAEIGKRSHGIFTFYFCKITSDSPSISPALLSDRMNPSLKRFNETFTFDTTNKELEKAPIFH